MNGIVHSFKVATTLSAYRAVTLLSSSGDTVAYPEAATRVLIGITKDTVKDTTESIPVAVCGSIAKLYFNDSCAAGQLVKVDTSGRGSFWGTFGVTTVAVTAAVAYVGVLVGPGLIGASCTGTLADVLVMPGFERQTS